MPHVSGRGAKHRLGYKSDRYSRPFSSFRNYTREPVNYRRRRPDISMTHDRQENDESRHEPYHRPDNQLSSELHTDVTDKHECSFFCFWRIENFCIDEASQGCSINSQMFEILMTKGSQWQLRVEHGQHESLSLCLIRHGEQGCVDIHVELSVLTTDGWMSVKDSVPNLLISGSPCIGTELLNWNEQLQVETRLPDGCLTVSCHISIQSALFNPVQYFMPSRMISHKMVIHSPMLEFSDLNPNEVMNFPIPCILTEHLSTSDGTDTKGTQTESETTEDCDSFSDSEDLLKLFKEKNFRYVTLRTATKDFAVHKALLCAKSPVFNAMFKGPMEENTRDVVNIDDIDSDCLSLLLRFFHLEPLRDLKWEEAAKLYYAADKYQVHLLQTKCRSLLKNKLSSKNICDALILADTHKDADLRESALEYFCINSKAILCSSEWTNFLFNRVDLASKVLFKLGESM